MLAVLISVWSLSYAGGDKERHGYNYPSDEDISEGNLLCEQGGLDLDSVEYACEDGTFCSIIVHCVPAAK